MRGKLTESDVERAYEYIAQAIDKAGPAGESAFLARLCLALAAQMDDLAAVEEAIRIARESPS